MLTQNRRDVICITTENRKIKIIQENCKIINASVSDTFWMSTHAPGQIDPGT